jgi:hypothetical protein
METNDIVDRLLYEEGQICTDTLRQLAADEIGRLRSEAKSMQDAGMELLEMLLEQARVMGGLIDMVNKQKAQEMLQK